MSAKTLQLHRDAFKTLSAVICPLISSANVAEALKATGKKNVEVHTLLILRIANLLIGN